jgi:hypothetical protein
VEEGRKAIKQTHELALRPSSTVSPHHNHKQRTQTYKTLMAINTMNQRHSIHVAIFHHIYCEHTSRKLLMHKSVVFSPNDFNAPDDGQIG